jgi:hypothetical protein
MFSVISSHLPQPLKKSVAHPRIQHTTLNTAQHFNTAPTFRGSDQFVSSRQTPKADIAKQPHFTGKLHDGAKSGNWLYVASILPELRVNSDDDGDSNVGTVPSHLLNERDEQGNTPLDYASKGGHTAIIQGLIEVGADPNLESNGKTPLQLAKEYGDKTKNYNAYKLLRDTYLVTDPSRVDSKFSNLHGHSEKGSGSYAEVSPGERKRLNQLKKRHTA